MSEIKKRTPRRKASLEAKKPSLVSLPAVLVGEVVRFDTDYPNGISTSMIASITGIPPREIRKKCDRLGFKRIGRDIMLNKEQFTTFLIENSARINKTILRLYGKNASDNGQNSPSAT